MNTIGLEYGRWLGGMGFNYMATIRRHYPLTEFNTNTMMQRLIKYKAISMLFYAIEPDRKDKMTHAHLMFLTNSYYNRERLAKELGVDKKVVSYLNAVKDANSISYYCTKHIRRKCSFHDFLYI